jgi:hypothetical protein|tara:strand:+ start:147 stop:365 length:219 start_codon:yes stop_codon:yes gene_type:complete
MKHLFIILFLLPLFAREKGLNLTLENNSEVVEIMVGTVCSFILFFEGLIKGSFHSNISKEYIIGKKMGYKPE